MGNSFFLDKDSDNRGQGGQHLPISRQSLRPGRINFTRQRYGGNRGGEVLDWFLDREAARNTLLDINTRGGGEVQFSRQAHRSEEENTAF